MPVPLAYVQRGKIIESVHYGDVVVVDRNDAVIYAQGADDQPVYYRSASKPLQAAAALLAGILEQVPLSEEEIAILCGSHSGEAVHVQVVDSLMAKTGVQDSMLQLDPAYPMNFKATEAVIRAGAGKSKRFHNCVGKHIAMVLQCIMKGYDISTYYLPTHPVQQWYRQVIGHFCGIDAERVNMGCDGCGVPVFSVPLKNMAASFRKLAMADFPDNAYRKTCTTICEAMMNHPYLIAGEGRFDYILMESLKGRAIAKTGAEGVICIGLPEDGLGVAIKISDGSQRSMECIITRLMDILGCLHGEAANLLDDYSEQTIKNHRGEAVGRIYPVI
jgi:L-asparaginase II